MICRTVEQIGVLSVFVCSAVVSVESRRVRRHSTLSSVVSSLELLECARPAPSPLHGTSRDFNMAPVLRIIAAWDIAVSIGKIIHCFCSFYMNLVATTSSYLALTVVSVSDCVYTKTE
jgi:hypothetical protein